jgi:hypothetical protein
MHSQPPHIVALPKMMPLCSDKNTDPKRQRAVFNQSKNENGADSEILHRANFKPASVGRKARPLPITALTNVSFSIGLYQQIAAQGGTGVAQVARCWRGIALVSDSGGHGLRLCEQPASVSHPGALPPFRLYTGGIYRKRAIRYPSRQNNF